jgi:cellulose synthase/poly-beta-1,6-N-acetylglucosamine synthase-like glycosyltransferase
MTVIFIIGTILGVCCTIYVREITSFYRGLSKLRAGTNTSQPFLSVLVPARNEQDAVGLCVASLLAQDYPAANFEIIVIDDQSTDNTGAIVGELCARHPSLRLLRVVDRPASVSPKINALQFGINESRGEIIFTTDADCFVQPSWLSTCVRAFEENVGVVTGTTVFKNSQGVSPLLFGIQALDFLSHTACAAGAIGNASVNNCNGSNMAYRRSAYEQAGGYTALAHLNTGDDSLLAQRIASETSFSVRFVLDTAAQVTTFPVPTWKGFMLQRMRWAAQTSDYRTDTLPFLISTFIYYLLLLGTGAASFFDASYLVLFAVAYAPKLAVDYLILRKFTEMTQTRPLMKYYAAAAVIHIPVIFMAVTGGYFGRFEWKGRVLERANAPHPKN